MYDDPLTPEEQRALAAEANEWQPTLDDYLDGRYAKRAKDLFDTLYDEDDWEYDD